MTKFKSGLIKYLSIPLIAGGFLLTNTNAQQLSNKEKTDLQRGVKAGVLLESNSNYSVYGFKFDKGLEKSIKDSKSPKISLSGNYPVGIGVWFNKDTSGIKLQVPKNINYRTAKPIGIVLRNGINVNICDEKGNVGNKNTPISSFYFDPHQLYLQKFEAPTASVLDSLIFNDVKYIRGKVDSIGQKVDGLEGKISGIDSVVNANSKKLDSANEKLDYLTEQEKKRIEEEKKNEDNFTWDVEASKAIDRESGWSLRTGPNFKLTSGEAGSLWGGLYVEWNIDKFNQSYSKHVEKTELLNQQLEFYTRTSGDIVENINAKRTWGLGARLNWYTENGTFGLGVSGGAKYQTKTTTLTSQGVDEFLEGKKVIESKPYCFTNSSTEKGLVPSAKVQAYLAPFKEKNFKVTAGIEKILGKVQNEGVKIYGGIRYDF
ncbi:hypothetical protein GW931_02355 [archaeon]|nr:hypothetical protein [archaeon]